MNNSPRCNLESHFVSLVNSLEGQSQPRNDRTEHAGALPGFGAFVRFVVEAYTSVGSHDVHHALRVARSAVQIARSRELPTQDIAVLLIAAMSHDLGRNQLKAEICCHGVNHAERGASMLLRFAAREGYEGAAIYVDASQLVAIHNDRARIDGSLAQVLWDADKLDMLGAIGAMRCGMRAAELECGRHGSGHEDSFGSFCKELERIGSQMGPDLFFSAVAKAVAERHAAAHKATFTTLLRKLRDPTCPGRVRLPCDSFAKGNRRRPDEHA